MLGRSTRSQESCFPRRVVGEIPSVSGTDCENEAQAHMAVLMRDGGLDVDHWQLDLDTFRRHPDFPV